MSANLKTTTMATGLEKSVFIPIPNKGDGKGSSNHCTFALISHTSKILLKVFQAGLRQYMNQEIKSVTISTFSPSIYHGVMGPDAMIFIF